MPLNNSSQVLKMRMKLKNFALTKKDKSTTNFITNIFLSSLYTKSLLLMITVFILSNGVPLKKMSFNIRSTKKKLMAKYTSKRIISWKDGYVLNDKPVSSFNDTYLLDYWKSEGWGSAWSKWKFWQSVDGTEWTTDFYRIELLARLESLKDPKDSEDSDGPKDPKDPKDSEDFNNWDDSDDSNDSDDSDDSDDWDDWDDSDDSEYSRHYNSPDDYKDPDNKKQD